MSEEPKVRVELSHVIVCPKCGNVSPQGTRHCVNCGASLADVAATPPAAVKESRGGVWQRIFGRKKAA